MKMDENQFFFYSMEQKASPIERPFEKWKKYFANMRIITFVIILCVQNTRAVVCETVTFF